MSEADFFIGIDSGKKGAITSIGGGGIRSAMFPMSGGDYDIHAMAELFRSISSSRDAICIIEKVWAAKPAGRKNGASSMFSFGVGYGIVRGLAAAMGWRVQLVTPQAWKGEVLKGTKKDKGAACAFVRSFYPEVDLQPGLKKTDQDGIADSVCIAHYGRIMYEKK